MDTPWKLPPFYKLSITPEPGDAIVMGTDNNWWFVPADEDKVATMLPRPGML